MELGGSSPFRVLDDADFDEAVLGREGGFAGIHEFVEAKYIGRSTSKRNARLVPQSERRWP